jgi:hypothetical protein
LSASRVALVVALPVSGICALVFGALALGGAGMGVLGSGGATIRSDPSEASVFVDGEILNTGRELETSVASGPRTVRIEAPGYAPATRRVDIPANGEARLSVHLEMDVGDETRFGKLPGVLWLSAGVIGLAGAGTGIAALIFTLLNRDVEQPPSAIEVAGAPVEGGAMLMASGTWGAQ